MGARPPITLGLSRSLPAPVAGLNARDALADMGPKFAVILKNWFPRNTYCQLRHGYDRFATGITGWVETLMDFDGGTTNKLFAAAGTVIYEVTAGGAAVSSTTGMTNARWQFVNNTTTGGHYLQAVNGADKMAVYDGTAWHKDGDGVPYNVTGVNTVDCINIALAHNRVWLTEKATLKAWYLPVGAIGGAANALDLSSFCQHGGYLMTIASWTMDAGYGMDDMTVFITNQGEVLVFRGSDPASVATWGLVGIYYIGSPVGRRCCIKYQGDLLIITQDGVQPMSLALQSSRLNSRVNLTDVIQPLVSSDIDNYGANFGWQLLTFPSQNMLFLNVPVLTSQSQRQYVMNTISRAWCEFNGWNAACWQLFNDDAYFGGNGYVGKAWSGYSDAGANIMADGLQAFNYFDSRGINKQYTDMQPVLFTNGTPSLSTKMNIDFDLSAPTASVAFAPTSVGLWGSGIWGVSVWGGGLQIQQSWQGANGVGKCAAPHLVANCQGMDLQWMATNIIFKQGGML